MPAIADRRRAPVTRASLLLTALWPLQSGGPPVPLRVNHELAPGEAVAGWKLAPREQRIVYGVGDGSYLAKQVFSSAWDGSGDVRALTDPLPAQVSLGFWDYYEPTRRVALMHDLDTPGIVELYGVDAFGDHQPVKLNAPLEPDVEVLSMVQPPDDRRVLYLAGVPFSGNNALYSVPPDGSEPAVLLYDPPPGEYGIPGAVRVTPDSEHVLYWVRARLLCSPIDGSQPPVQLSPGPLGEEPWTVFQPTPDSQRIVFWASFPDGTSDVFSAPIDGSTPPTPLLFPGSSGVVDTGFRTSPDGRWVAGRTGTSFSELRCAPVDGSSPPAVLTAPNHWALAPFTLSQDGHVVFTGFSRNGASWGPRGIYVVPADGHAPAQRIVGFRGDPFPHQAVITERNRVLFGGHTGQWELFSVPLDGSAPALRLNPPMVPGGDVYQANTLDAGFVSLTSDAVWAVYEADQEVDGVRELFAVPADGRGPAVKLSGTLPAGANVVIHRIAPAGRRVFHDVWTATTRDVFTSVIPDRPFGGPATRTR
jgi:hypothetical protein